MKINQNKPEHRCFLLYCSCGELITGCGEGRIHPPDAATTKPVRLTRTSGCVKCRTEAQYVVFDRSYRPMPREVVIQKSVAQSNVTQSNVMLGTGNGAKPVITSGRMCPNCMVTINESNVCSLCGRNFQ
jgi:hypothetical protein